MHDVRARPILAAALAIALAVACTVAAVLAVLHVRGLPAGGARLAGEEGLPLSAPGLSSAPQPALARSRTGKEAWLHSSGWVDRKAGVAHIPIDAAMDRLVQESGR